MIGNADISPALSANNLGLVIDCYVNVIEHFGKISSKLRTGIFLLRRLSCFQSSNPPTVGLLLVFPSTFIINLVYEAMKVLKITSLKRVMEFTEIFGQRTFFEQ